VNRVNDIRLHVLKPFDDIPEIQVAVTN